MKIQWKIGLNLGKIELRVLEVQSAVRDGSRLQPQECPFPPQALSSSYGERDEERHLHSGTSWNMNRCALKWILRNRLQRRWFHFHLSLVTHTHTFPLGVVTFPHEQCRSSFEVVSMMSQQSSNENDDLDIPSVCAELAHA